MRASDEEIPAHEIARIVHEALRGFQVWLEDPCPAQPWDTLDEEQREAVTNTVRLIQRGFPYDYVHQIRVDRMKEEGWTWGNVKVPEAKHHPCIVSWDLLPFWEQQEVVLAFHVVQGVVSRGR